MSQPFEIETTINDLSIHCEGSIESGQFTLEAVNIKVCESREYSPQYIVKKDIIDILKPSSIALLQTKCQELWDEDQLL